MTYTLAKLYKEGMHDLSTGVAAVIRAYKTKIALAKAVGRTRSAISQWKRVPLEHVQKLEQETGIDRAVLRPDVYGPRKAA